MKYEARIQVEIADLSDAFFENIIVYELIRPSGLGGPGCIIMISDEGQIYQFQGYDLDVLNFYSAWHQAIPLLTKYIGKDGRLHYDREITGWKSIEIWGGILILRSDFYPKYMECQKPLGDPIQFKSAYFTEDICMKAILLNNVKTIQEKESINRKYEFRKPLFEKGDLVSFVFGDGTHQWSCKGVIAGVDIYRVQGKIEDIEYDIKGSDYINHNKTMYYKHIGESLIQKASGSIWIVSGFISELEKRKLKSVLQEQYPKEYIILKRAVIDSKICNLCFRGKKVLLLIEPHEIVQIKKSGINIHSLFFTAKTTGELRERFGKSEEALGMGISEQWKAYAEELSYVEAFQCVFSYDEDTNTGFIHMFSETHDTVLRSAEQQLEECKMLQQEIMDKLYEVEN